MALPKSNSGGSGEGEGRARSGQQWRTWWQARALLARQIGVVEAWLRWHEVLGGVEGLWRRSA